MAPSGGWGHNGGYGPLTSQYGLGVDQWLEAKIVTPDGQLKVANAVSNPDLFWAIRGGGGGTFGVVVEATFKAYPSVPISVISWYVNSTITGSNVTNHETGESPTSKAVQYFLSQTPDLQAQRISVYVSIHASDIRGFAIHPGDASGHDKVNAVWGPILTKMSSFPNMTPFQTKPYHFDNYRAFWDTTYGPLAPLNKTVGVPEPFSRGITPYDSILLAPEHLRSENITYALRGLGGDLGCLVTAPGDRVGDGSDTSANPGWRKAAALIVTMKTSNAPTGVDTLRQIAPDMGGYINEVRTPCSPPPSSSPRPR